MALYKKRDAHRRHVRSNLTPLRSEVLQPPVGSPTCQVTDPFILRPFWAFIDESLDAYLVGLAAFQRGLAVRFHYEVASTCERFARLSNRGAGGELLSVSDGERTHFFRRAQGDQTSRRASAIMEHKPATKALLTKHGINVPSGVVVDKQNLQRARAFCRRHARETFLIKPLAGTLGRDVHRELTSDEVLEFLKNQAASVLLEVFVKGQEYRVHVVNGRYIGAVARLPAQVTGDGSSSVRELIEESNRRRAAHVLYRKMPIKSDATLQEHLDAAHLTLDSVPPDGQVVTLGRIPMTGDGGESPIRSHELSLQARRVAIRVQQALQVPNTGIDLLVCNEGTSCEKVVVLEANQCPFQTVLVAPLVAAAGMGNHHAEALMDTYFPASRTAQRWPAASFDFITLRRVLPTSVASSFGLPVIQPDWQHQRLSLTGDEQRRVDVEACLSAMRLQRVVVQAMTLSEGNLLVDALGAPAALAASWRLWPGSVGERCDP